MALDRTWFNTLIDSSGTPGTGTIIDKAFIDALMDAIDASLGYLPNTGVVLGAGVTDDYALPAGTQRLTVTSDAAGSTLAGMAGGVDGRVLAILNIGAGNTLTITNEAGTSAAANRFGSSITLTGGQCAIFLYTNRWRCIASGK